MQILSYTASPQNISLASSVFKILSHVLLGGSRTPNRTSNLATLIWLLWLPIHDRIKFKIATMTHKAIYTCNPPPYLANLLQWHTPSRNLRSASANLLSVTRCNISFGARDFRSAVPAIWNNLPSNVRSCETLRTFRRHLKSHLFHSAFATA